MPQEATLIGTSTRPKVVVAVCTYNRNQALTTLLEALQTSVTHLGERAAVGVVIVDDSNDARARPIAEQYKNHFELGVVFCVSGRQNISLARNLAIETAMRQSGVVHEVRDANPVDPVLADARGSPADDLVVVVALVGARMTHASPSVDS